MDAKILCVYNEGAKVDTPFVGAKGFSILVDVDGQKTLFDTGMRGRYLVRNLGRFRIKPEEIDRVVISHNHRSNTGGLARFIDERKTPIELYVNSLFMKAKTLFGKPLIAGERVAKVNVHEMENVTQLSPHLFAFGPFGPLEEYSLVIMTTDGPVIITSCYHNGTRCVLEAVKQQTKRNPACMIGGIHAPKATQAGMDPTAEIIKAYGTPRMYFNHCASPNGITFLRVRFSLEKVHDFYAGETLDFKTGP